MPGHAYVGPYVTFEPSLALLAVNAAGVCGYIVAALDSRVFEHRLEQDWWPALRARYRSRQLIWPRRMSPPERYAIHDIHHPFGAPEQVTERFPSHLHVNLAPRMQGRGIGRRLIATLIARLHEQGSRGLHLLVGSANQQAIGFYRHIGFAELSATGVHVFGMRIADGSFQPCSTSACEPGE